MTNTLRRKTKLSLDDIRELVSDIRSLTTVRDLTTGVYARCWATVRRYGLQTHDSMILACAIESGLAKVLSEDMQNGLSVFDMTTIRDPFAAVCG